MSLDIAALDHICNNVRREMQDELRDLTLFFIACTRGDRQAALDAKQAELLEHPAGDLMLPVLQKLAATDHEKFSFAGLASREQKQYLGLVRRRITLAAFFVNADELETTEEARQYALQLAWHAISLLETHHNSTNTDNQDPQNLTRPHYSAASFARENMLGDVFSAIILEQSGHKNAIRSLAQKRCITALQPVRGYKAEQYPFPVAADAVQVVYEELFKGSGKTKPVRQAIQITREIDLTYDDTSIRQWRLFSLAAQEMAWLGFDKSRILGTALYTSEDPYVRSTAYLVSEILNMEPAALTDLGSYNPFTDQEANERLHLRTCEESIKRVISQLQAAPDGNSVQEEINRQNKLLMKGHTLGWCASALKEAAELYHITASRDHATIKAMEIFHEGLKELPWESLRNLSRLIMNKRRQGTEITPAVIAKLCEKEDHLRVVTKMLEDYLPDDNKPQGSMLSYTSPHGLERARDTIQSHSGFPGDKNARK